MAEAVYLETSWSILSTIGVFLTFAAISVVFITHACPLNFVPVVVSIACAVANGACYYAYYTDNAPGRLVAAGVFADLLWMVQEAGLSFYNYQILSHILRHRARTVFLSVFWSLIVVIVGIRLTVVVLRAIQLSNQNLAEQNKISRLHVGYFVSIALLETWGAVFLIKELATAYLRSPRTSTTHGVLRYLLRSAELRLASLCCIGISRAVTYSSQSTQQRATTVAAQVDRFVYTIECLFPVVMLLDILGSKRYRHSEQAFDENQIDHGQRGSSSLHHAQWVNTSQGKCVMPRDGGHIQRDTELWHIDVA